MRQLIEKDDVLAIIGDVGTPTATAAIPIANEQKTLFFASFSGGGILRKSPKNHGLKEEKDVLNVGYERNTLAVEDAVATLLVAEHLPRAVIMVGAYAPCGKFIKLCHEAGLHALFLNVSFVGSSSLAHELGKIDAQVIVTQVVPYPLDENVSIVRDYQTDLRAVDPSTLAGFGGLEGYIAARILELALDKIEGRLTREAVVDALEKLGQFDIGLGEPLNLSSNEHQASHRIWPTILKDGGFVPFQWDDIGHLLKNSSAMSTTQGARRIFWMVRLLGALGLVIVVVIICQVSFQLSSIRNSRTRLQSEEDRQNQSFQRPTRIGHDLRRLQFGLLFEGVNLS